MKFKYGLSILITAWLLLGSGAVLLVMAQAPAGSQLRLLATDEQSLVLELTIADFQIEMVEYAGQTYHRLLIAGLVQTGAPGDPQVPARGALLGLPTTEGVSVQVLEADYELLSGYHLYPAPGLQVTGDDLTDPLVGGVQPTFTLNRDRYAADAFYPGRPVEIGHTGYMRGQAVAQVQFYPVQYNPVAGEVRLYRRILARVAWPRSLSAAAAETRTASPAYEEMLRSALLNYETLERPTVAGTTPSPDLPGAGIVAAGSATPTLKIEVTADGLYELTYGDLTGAGLGSLDPRTIKLNHRGVEIPIYVAGEDDGLFNLGDAVLFYGAAFNDMYTGKNVYWLTAGGSSGQRMGTRAGTLSGSAPAPEHFPVTLQAEEDTEYWVTMPNGQGQDHWFWGGKLTAPASRNYVLTLPNISTTAGTATVRLRLKGRTDVFDNPDHHTRLYLNGVEIDDQWWNGFSVYDHQVVVPHAYLDEGSNTLRVRGVGDTGAVADQFYINWIELDYWGAYVAEGDELVFGAPAAGAFQFEISGFSRADGQVFDITDSANVVRITDTTVVAGGSGYKLQFEDAAQPGTRYLALTPAQRKSPAGIKLDQPSLWKSPGNGADYIIITPEDFYTSALRLASHRAAEGLRVATVKVEDIYDEFNGGIFNPQAIRDFLTYAYEHWTAPAPTYVLLLGGASYDYRDLLDLKRANYVPTQIIETDSLGQTPSDNWFVLLDGPDLLPDMFIGRLTPQDVLEADDMVDKIIYYEQNPADDSWNKEVLLVADDDSAAFESILEQLAAQLPLNYSPNKVYAAGYPPGDPTIDIKDHLNSGSILVNYTGHGNVDLWGAWSGGLIFDRADITTLNNSGKLPVVAIANCLNGYFAGKKVSMAEEFLQRPDKGAVAVWASTSLGYSSGHRALMGEFYEAIFQKDQYALGAATTAAKIAVYAQSSSWDELVETFVLFGDPAMQLGIPPNYPYVESTTPTDGAGEAPLKQNLQIVFSKPMSPTTVLLSDESATGLTFTPLWNADNTILNYTHPDFDYGQTLTFTISGQDQLGLPLGPGVVPATWSFTTYGFPYVESTIPAAGAGDVPIDQDLQVVFNKPMNPATVSLSASGSGGLVFTPTWNVQHTILNYAHPNFGHGQILTFTVDGQDELGAPLDTAMAPNTWFFMVTNDAELPKSGISMAGGGLSDVSIAAPIIITFSEAMRPDSIAYTVVPAVTGRLAWDGSGQIATFNHTGFRWRETYTFTVITAKDVAGNSLSGPLRLAFTTQEPELIYLPYIVKYD